MPPLPGALPGAREASLFAALPAAAGPARRGRTAAARAPSPRALAPARTQREEAALLRELLDEAELQATRSPSGQRHWVREELGEGEGRFDDLELDLELDLDLDLQQQASMPYALLEPATFCGTVRGRLDRSAGVASSLSAVPAESEAGEASSTFAQGGPLGPEDSSRGSTLARLRDMHSRLEAVEVRLDSSKHAHTAGAGLEDKLRSGTPIAFGRPEPHCEPGPTPTATTATTTVESVPPQPVSAVATKDVASRLRELELRLAAAEAQREERPDSPWRRPSQEDARDRDSEFRAFVIQELGAVGARLTEVEAVWEELEPGRRTDTLRADLLQGSLHADEDVMDSATLSDFGEVQERLSGRVESRRMSGGQDRSGDLDELRMRLADLERRQSLGDESAVAVPEPAEEEAAWAAPSEEAFLAGSPCEAWRRAEEAERRMEAAEGEREALRRSLRSEQSRVRCLEAKVSALKAERDELAALKASRDVADRRLGEVERHVASVEAERKRLAQSLDEERDKGRHVRMQLAALKSQCKEAVRHRWDAERRLQQVREDSAAQQAGLERNLETVYSTTRRLQRQLRDATSGHGEHTSADQLLALLRGLQGLRHGLEPGVLPGEEEPSDGLAHGPGEAELLRIAAGCKRGESQQEPSDQAVQAGASYSDLWSRLERESGWLGEAMMERDKAIATSQEFQAQLRVLESEYEEARRRCAAVEADRSDLLLRLEGEAASRPGPPPSELAAHGGRPRHKEERGEDAAEELQEARAEQELLVRRLQEESDRSRTLEARLLALEAEREEAAVDVERSRRLEGRLEALGERHEEAVACLARRRSDAEAGTSAAAQEVYRQEASAHILQARLEDEEARAQALQARLEALNTERHEALASSLGEVSRRERLQDRLEELLERQREENDDIGPRVAEGLHRRCAEMESALAECEGRLRHEEDAAASCLLELRLRLAEAEREKREQTHGLREEALQLREQLATLTVERASAASERPCSTPEVAGQDGGAEQELRRLHDAQLKKARDSEVVERELRLVAEEQAQGLRRQLEALRGERETLARSLEEERRLLASVRGERDALAKRLDEALRRVPAPHFGEPPAAPSSAERELERTRRRLVACGAECDELRRAHAEERDAARRLQVQLATAAAERDEAIAREACAWDVVRQRAPRPPAGRATSAEERRSRARATDEERRPLEAPALAGPGGRPSAVGGGRARGHGAATAAATAAAREAALEEDGNIETFKGALALQTRLLASYLDEPWGGERQGEERVVTTVRTTPAAWGDRGRRLM